MMYDFNAAEVFNVAVKIEENGAKFYRRAAELQSDPENKNFWKNWQPWKTRTSLRLQK